MKLYAISGLGADDKAFQYLEIPRNFELIVIPWLIPETKESLAHYALRMQETINPNEEFVLMGLSFGGILAQEINQYLKPKHNLLISTIKGRQEMPKLFRFGSKTNIHKAIPIEFFTNDSVLSYTFFRKLYDSRMPKLHEFFAVKDKQYLRWSIDQILNWQPQQEIQNYSHIHGGNDLVFPHKNLKNVVVVPKASHLMVIQKPKPINRWLQQELTQL